MRKLFTYLLCVNLAIFPIYKANAFVGALAVAFSNPVVRFAATEILIDVAARGFAANDPLFNTSARLSKSKYINFLRGKGKAIAFIAAGLTAAGFIVGDNITKPSNVKVNDVAPVKGIAWSGSGRYDVSPSALGDQICKITPYCSDFKIDLYSNDATRKDLRTLTFVNASGVKIQSQTASSLTCNYAPSSVASCAASYIAPSVTDNLATDQDIDSKFFSWLSSQPQHDQYMAFSGSDGRIHPDIAKELQVDAPPLMPDGQALPAVGTQSWVYADMIARGIGQQTDANAQNYIPPAAWSDASYLANKVAAGNQSITSSNAKGTALPGEAASTATGATFPAEISVNNLGGIESRLDSANKLLTDMSQTSVSIATAPTVDKSKSYWDKKYPGGLSAVWSDFYEKVKKTPLFTWVYSFKIQISGAGYYPSWSFCTDLGFIDFGCHDLTIPPSVWIAIRSFMIFCAGLLARRLVFGG